MSPTIVSSSSSAFWPSSSCTSRAWSSSSRPPPSGSSSSAPGRWTTTTSSRTSSVPPRTSCSSQGARTDGPAGEEGPGHPVRYGTTQLFLERLGLDSLAKLPPLADLMPGPEALEDLEARLREASRPARPRRRRRGRRTGDNQGQLVDGDWGQAKG